MKKKINTDSNSLTKIYIEKEIGSLWYNHNEKEKDNSPEATIKYLERISALADVKQFVNVRVQPVCDEGDMNNLESYFIKVIGYREETDQEFKKRMGNKYQDMIRGRDSKIQSMNYYNSDVFKEELEKIKKLGNSK